MLIKIGASWSRSPIEPVPVEVDEVGSRSEEVEVDEREEKRKSCCS